METTEEAEQKQTGTAFPACLPPGKAGSLIARTGFVPLLELDVIKNNN